MYLTSSMASNGLKWAHKMYVSFDCYAYAFFWQPLTLRKLQMPPLPKQKHGSLFGDKLSNFTSKFKRKEAKMSEVTSPIPSITSEPFSSSKLIMRTYLPCKSSVWEKIEILTSLSCLFFSLNKLAWCFCFKLNYVQRVLTLGKGQYLDILQNMSRCSHLKCEVLSNSEFLLKFVHIVTLCSYLKGQLSSLRNLDF